MRSINEIFFVQPRSRVFKGVDVYVLYNLSNSSYPLILDKRLFINYIESLLYDSCMKKMI